MVRLLVVLLLTVSAAAQIEANGSRWSGPCASKPAAGVDGRTYRCTDTGTMWIDTGVAWFQQADASTVNTTMATKADAVHTHTKSQVTDFAHGSSSHDGTVPQVIASGTATFATTAIASKACSATVTVAATGAAATDVITWSYQADPAAATNAQLNMNFWATPGFVNFKRCNSTAASITPTAVVVNWKVIR